jgi:hypothetical protein
METTLQLPYVKLSYFIASGLFLLLILVSEMYYRKPLFDLSLTVIPLLQSKASQAGISFWKFYTDVALVLIEAVPLALTYLLAT